jgi:hypothetical protein
MTTWISRHRSAAVLTGLTLMAATALAAEAPEPPKVSSFAPAEDLLKQVDFFVKRIDESLATKEGYDEAKQTRTLKDAHTLAVIGQMLGKHDQENKIKESAANLIKSTQALAKGSKDFDAATAAFADVKKAAAGEAPGGGEVKWEKVASLGALMKQVPLVNAGLKRGMSPARFERQAAETAGHSATLASIAQAAMFDTHEVKDPNDTSKWYEFCAELRDASAEINAAAKAKDQAKAAAAMAKLTQSCDRCHEVFRKELAK